MPQKLKMFCLKIHKGAGIKKKPKTFLHKVTKQKKLSKKSKLKNNKNINFKFQKNSFF